MEILRKERKLKVGKNMRKNKVGVARLSWVAVRCFQTQFSFLWAFLLAPIPNKLNNGEKANVTNNCICFAVVGSASIWAT